MLCQSSDRCVLPEAGRKSRDREIGGRSGPGKAAEEESRAKAGCQMSKDGEEEQFRE